MENSSKDIGDAPFATEEPFKVYRCYYERQIFASVLILTSIFGFVGNVMVLITVSLSRKLRTVTNVFVVTLSISDLISCVFLPWQVVAVLSEDGWPLPQAYWICQLTSVMLTIGNNCTINMLALIAVNRWIGVTKSRATTCRVYTCRNIACMVAFSVIIPIFVSVILPLIGIGEMGYEPLYSSCSWVKDNPYSFVQNIVIGVLHFPIQFTVICACYVSIFRYVLKSSRRVAGHDIPSVSGVISGAERAMRKRFWKRQIAVTKNLVYIVLAYIICLLPFSVSVIPLGYDWSIRMTPYAAAIMNFNTFLNPIIYATSHPDFKETFGCMVRCKCKDIPRQACPK
ncbi:melatonin receptor type 1B-B-like [Patiria miniata]|uniref:G-protein coupled receptors family 1 profile domain-containing protein n=1 Tax=Patiria miniata TaxID=46514 RepID=A0A913YZU8_PATMI|nr:melatonin receptor type 1B-B-like [Patiria miniata]